MTTLIVIGTPELDTLLDALPTTVEWTIQDVDTNAEGNQVITLVTPAGAIPKAARQALTNHPHVVSFQEVRR